jgi:hypothetical protein
MQWSKIFLPEMKSVGGIQGRKMLSNSNLLTSQSVFCFPIAKDKIDMKSVENTDNSDAKITTQKHISKVIPKLLNVNSASTSNK